MCLGNLIHISPKIGTSGTTRLIIYLHLQLRQIINNTNHVKGCLNPGAIAQIRRLKITEEKYQHHQDLTARGVNQSDLKQIRITESNGLEVVNNIRLATLNARLVKNKDLIICQEVNNHKIDIAFITETWLQNTQEDEAWTN